MKIAEITGLLESVAPLNLQESYDNSGLIVGQKNWEVKSILLCLDSTEEVVDEAIEKGCNLIIAHHPIVFSGLKKINGEHYVERAIVKAIKNDIAIYACHTNLDRVYQDGVSQKISEKLALANTKILVEGNAGMNKLVSYVPVANKEDLLQALFTAGAGAIGAYDECSFTLTGEGTFRALDGAEPYVGLHHVRHREQEARVEVLVEDSNLSAVLKAMNEVHPYEEVAHDLIPLSNSTPLIGFGVIGELDKAMSQEDFLAYLKEKMNLSQIRYTNCDKKIKSVAVCGGSGSFLLSAIKRSGADAYVTADVKYHEFFEPDGDYLLADIGHYESEIFTLEIFHKVIKEKFPTFAVLFTDRVTNPVKYY